jgi:hypothetical protein
MPIPNVRFDIVGTAIADKVRLAVDVWPSDHWCCFHNVIEDGNVDDDAVEWCLYLARTGKYMGRDGRPDEPARRDADDEPYPHAHCVELGEALLKLNEDQRWALDCQNWEGEVDRVPPPAPED